MILYAETNLPMGVAKGRERHLDDLLALVPDRLRLALPCVCLMEAWSVFESEQKRRRDFGRQLQSQISDLRRDLSSLHARSLLNHIEQARVDNENVLSDVDRRLRDAIAKLVSEGKAELIALTPDTVQTALTLTQVMEEPTDNLILSAILHHARLHPGERKILLTSNSNDFDVENIRDLLSNAGIERQFARIEAFLGWFGSLSDIDASTTQEDTSSD